MSLENVTLSLEEKPDNRQHVIRFRLCAVSRQDGSSPTKVVLWFPGAGGMTGRGPACLVRVTQRFWNQVGVMGTRPRTALWVPQGRRHSAFLLPLLLHHLWLCSRAVHLPVGLAPCTLSASLLRTRRGILAQLRVIKIKFT